VMGARLLLVKGRLQRSDDIVHVVADALEDRSDWLLRLMEDRQTMPPPAPRDPVARHPRQVRIMPRTRDFH